MKPWAHAEAVGESMRGVLGQILCEHRASDCRPLRLVDLAHSMLDACDLGDSIQRRSRACAADCFENVLALVEGARASLSAAPGSVRDRLEQVQSAASEALDYICDDEIDWEDA